MRAWSCRIMFRESFQYKGLREVSTIFAKLHSFLNSLCILFQLLSNFDFFSIDSDVLENVNRMVLQEEQILSVLLLLIYSIMRLTHLRITKFLLVQRFIVQMICLILHRAPKLHMYTLFCSHKRLWLFSGYLQFFNEVLCSYLISRFTGSNKRMWNAIYT